MKNERAARCSGVDFFRERMKPDAALLEVVHHCNHVAHAAGQPVELPNYQRVAVLQRLKATEQGRALLHPACCNRIQLHVGVLVIVDIRA
jgi:hypothetical protein